MLFDVAPAAKRTIESLFKLVESSLPLSSLYLDLNSDKPVENDIETTTGEIELLLKSMLDNMATEAMKIELLERLSVSEPFVNYSQLLKEYRVGGVFDE